MEYRGKSLFVAVAWLCGSACNIYDSDSLQSERKREQPATAARPRDSRSFDIIGVRAPFVMIDPRSNNASEPPTHAEPVAGARAPSVQMDRPRCTQVTSTAAGTDSDDAGVALEQPAVDAGARDADAGSPQKIETGVPHEVDAGRPRPVAKASATCRGELGYETEGRCYFMLDEHVSWNVGRDHCYEHDAHLASVTSKRESDLVASFELERDVWIGFSRFGAANFSWLTTEMGSFTNWQEGAPRAMQESGALIKASTGLWTNRAVPELHAVLCETERP